MGPPKRITTVTQRIPGDSPIDLTTFNVESLKVINNPSIIEPIPSENIGIESDENHDPWTSSEDIVEEEE